MLAGFYSPEELEGIIPHPGDRFHVHYVDDDSKIIGARPHQKIMTTQRHVLDVSTDSARYIGFHEVIGQDHRSAVAALFPKEIVSRCRTPRPQQQAVGDTRIQPEQVTGKRKIEGAKLGG
ncbi:MAG: hypothetical protein WD688_23715 [Candidatus Binatia bacterium]